VLGQRDLLIEPRNDTNLSTNSMEIAKDETVTVRQQRKTGDTWQTKQRWHDGICVGSDWDSIDDSHDSK
jgi:hypothetical protein